MAKPWYFEVGIHNSDVAGWHNVNLLTVLGGQKGSKEQVCDKRKTHQVEYLPDHLVVGFFNYLERIVVAWTPGIKFCHVSGFWRTLMSHHCYSYTLSQSSWKRVWGDITSPLSRNSHAVPLDVQFSIRFMLLSKSLVLFCVWNMGRDFSKSAFTLFMFLLPLWLVL